MSDAEIASAQDRFGLTFPPDHRLFLAPLHTPEEAHGEGRKPPVPCLTLVQGRC
jgi:hypothetical protein